MRYLFILVLDSVAAASCSKESLMTVLAKGQLDFLISSKSVEASATLEACLMQVVMVVEHLPETR